MGSELCPHLFWIPLMLFGACKQTIQQTGVSLLQLLSAEHALGFATNGFCVMPTNYAVSDQDKPEEDSNRVKPTPLDRVPAFFKLAFGHKPA